MNTKLRRVLAALGLLVAAAISSPAATFTNNASIQVASDPSQALTSTSGVFTVSCWFRMSIPSSANLSENMIILMDRADGNESANHSYQIRYNITNNTVEFFTRGTGGTYTKALIVGPYLERWYHVAVTRSASMFHFYVDGRSVDYNPESGSPAVGSSAGAGFSIGGINGNSRLFLGDIIELAIYHGPPVLSQSAIISRMYADQRSQLNLFGYYKLGYSTNALDYYRNFVPSPPAGTDPAVKAGTGSVGFDQVDQSGEQSAFDSRKNRGEEAITPLSGAFAWQQVAFARPTPGVAFDFRFGYFSATPTLPPADGSLVDPYEPRTLGKCWRHTFDFRILPDSSSSSRRLITWDGNLETWIKTNSIWLPQHREYRGELALVDNGDFEWTTPERLVYRFRDPTLDPQFDADGPIAGRLIQIRDTNANTVQLSWNLNQGYLDHVVDSAGGIYQFSYDSQNLLTNVAFGGWQVRFTYDGSGRLISKTLTNTSAAYASVPTTWQFFYSGDPVSTNLLARIVDPRGNDSLRVAYDKYGRKTNEVDALSRATATRYGVPASRQVTRIDPATYSWVETYDRKGHILAQQDPLGNTTSYTYDDFGNRTSITEPLGWTTLFGYDSRANVVARTNALGEVSRWVFHPFFNKAVQEITPQPADTNGWTTWTNFFAYDAHGNLTNHYDALGSLVSYTYSTNGLPLTAVDANGHVSRFTYNANGFLIAKTDPANNTTTCGYNDVGWKLAETNALGQATVYSPDINGNITLAVDPLHRNFTRTYDGNGNLLTQSDARGQLTHYAYDPANQKTNMVDRTGTNIWTFTYTSRGKAESATDPLGTSVTNYYDAANRAIAVRDPLGSFVTNIYNANGKVTTMIDKLGQQWSKTYDRLSRVVADTDPLGNTRRTTFDVAGRIQQITTPNGYPSIHSYDGRGRLVKWVDAMNFPWLYAYDGVGNITNITDALGGHYAMAYGPRNERLLEHNQDGFQWQYAYDELLRLKTQSDPNGTLRTLVYDAGGRLTNAFFSTGRTNLIAYDVNNNPTLLNRIQSGGQTATRFTYDVLDRVIQQIDPNHQVVSYAYDALGRVTTLTYPPYGQALTQRVDPLGRLTNQIDWAGRQMIYTYDKANRLITRIYPNGIAQTNAFDNANRLTGLSHSALNPQPSTLNIALTYAYDRNGNKTDSTEKGTLAWAMPTLTDETAHYTASGRLIDRTVAQLSTNNSQLITYQYDPSGNMTNAAGNGQTWALTYDEDNRVTSVFWDCPPLTSESIANRYDALGRRISRTVDGTETDYVLDLSSGMERILCDLNPDATVSYYVHGPDLCYKVDATNGLTCYHADALGNVIALTGGSTNTIAQYAYTPYGRSLASTNFQSQSSNPYLFVGSQGVMEELPDLYFMRARYFSADAALFLSTDPVKHIGAGWRPAAYAYAQNNPIGCADPSGLLAFSQVLGTVDLVGEFMSPVNLGLLIGGEIGYGVGYLERNRTVMNHSRGAIAIPFQSVVADYEAMTGSTVNFAINGAVFNDTMADSLFSDSPEMYKNLQGVILAGNIANAALDLGTLADTASQAHTALSKGEWGQVGGYIMSALRPQAEAVGSDIAGFLLMGNQQPTGQSPASSSAISGSSGNSPLASRTPAAASAASVLNGSQASKPASTYICITPTPTPSPPRQSSNNNAFSSVSSTLSSYAQNTVNTVTHAVQQVVNTVSTAVNRAVSSVSSFLGGLFGGGRR